MVKEVALNIVAQIMFFIVNVFVISWISGMIIDKHGDRNKLFKQYEECKNEKIKARIEKKIERSNRRLAFNMVIESWTVGLVKKVVRFLILLITINAPEIRFQIGNGEYDKNDRFLVKGMLYINMRTAPVKEVWWIPWNMVSMTGWCLCRVVDIIIGPFMGICLLSVLLPTTFSSVVSNISQVMPIRGAIDSDFFLRCYNCFIDTAWNKLMVGGFEENPIFLIIFVTIFICFLADGYFEVVEDGKLNEELLCLPWTVIFIILINVIFAVLNPVGYASVSNFINFLGMSILFVMLLKEIANITFFCTNSVISIIRDKMLPF